MRPFHLDFQLLDLDQMSRIQRQGRIITVGFVSAEASIGGLLAARLHGGREPQVAKIPVVISQIANRWQVFTRRHRALVVDHPAGRSRVALHLGSLRLHGLGNQPVHINIDSGFEKAVFAGVVIFDRATSRIFVNHGAEFRVSRVVYFQFFRIRRRRADVIEIYLIRLQLVLQKVVPFKHRVLIRVHEARAGLHIEPGILLLQKTKLAGRVDDDLPGSGFPANFVMLLLQPVDAEGQDDVQFRAFLQHSGDVGQDALLNLAVGSDVHGFEPVVGVKGPHDFRQILSRKGLATGENQDAEIAAKSFGDRLDFMCFHLQHFARGIIELVGEKTMSATHIAHRGHQDVQQTWRERLPQSQFCVTSQQISHKSIFDERQDIRMIFILDSMFTLILANVRDQHGCRGYAQP